MRKSEIDKQYLHTEDGVFTPLYTSDNPIAVLDDNKQIVDYNLPNFKLIKTAEQVYQECQETKANPPITETTEAEKIAKYMLDLDYRLSLQELGGK